MAGRSAIAIITGSFVGLSATVASAASTTPVSLALTSGTFAPQGNTPKALPSMVTPALAGEETTVTGNIKTAALIVPPQPETNTGTTETIKIYEATPNSARATINTQGELTVSDTLLIQIDITEPLAEQCVTLSPVNVLLQSVSPYNPSTEEAALSDTSFTIPTLGNLTPTSCKLAANTVNARFAGSVGNVLTMNLHGALVVPPPATATTTTLSATPPGPVLVGSTTVTLSAKITGAGATNPTTGPSGTMKFFNGATLLATKPVSGTTTTFNAPASAFPSGTNRLTAVYSGGNGFKASTSAALTFVVTPTPSVALTNLPSSVTGGTATLHTFTVTVTNPADSSNFTHLFLQMHLTGIRNLSSHTVTLQYKDSSGTWCTLVTFRGLQGMTGYIVGLGSTCTPTFPASFSLATSHSLLIHLRVAFPTAGFYGVQNVGATLSTGTCTTLTTTTTILVRCTAVAPLEGTVAPSGSGTITVVPSSPIPSKVTDLASRKATSTVRQTFNMALQSAVGPVTAGSGLPVPTGTVTYKVNGITVATSLFTGNATGNARTTEVLHNVATLSVGEHTLTSTYSGDSFYQSSVLSETFVVDPRQPELHSPVLAAASMVATRFRRM